MNLFEQSHEDEEEEHIPKYPDASLKENALQKYFGISMGEVTDAAPAANTNAASAAAHEPHEDEQRNDACDSRISSNNEVGARLFLPW